MTKLVQSHSVKLVLPGVEPTISQWQVRCADN